MSIMQTFRRAVGKASEDPVGSAQQTEQRQRRRAQMPIVYRGSFDLTEEITAICAPLAERIAATEQPVRFTPAVDEVYLAVHQAVLDLGKLLTERDARRRTDHLSIENRGRAIHLIVTARRRPQCPELVVDTLAAGTWPTVLAEHVHPLTGPLSDYLGVALEPGTTRGLLSVSEHVEKALRVIDRAALTCERLLDRVEANAAAAAAKSAPTTDDTAEELRLLGVPPLEETSR
ncbi:hypothetical protein [Prescottella equi]|uniref:hypothetical protein n=1 Tax=Rhodococcus hoagii TaxID=43767 RepID=UPI000A10E2DD|nr:hypothetical protein [Prescottella equi]ORL76408.1 hypothetical protein A5N71_16345 [Prescottella equi]